MTTRGESLDQLELCGTAARATRCTRMPIASSDLQARLPDVTSSLTAEPLDDEVTIVRDSFGVPLEAEVFALCTDRF